MNRNSFTAQKFLGISKNTLFVLNQLLTQIHIIMKKLSLCLLLTVGFVFSANAGCLEDAWDFGTKYGGGDEALEYELTDAYAQEFCGV